MIINPVLYSGKKLPELDNPGTAADLLAGKQLVDQYGNPLTGTMPEVAQAAPSISVASNGLITASASQSAGHVAAGTKSATKQLTTQAGKTVTPGTSRQTAVASGRYTTGAVYVAGDANLKAENIKSGVSIFGVSGNMPGKETVLLTIQNKTQSNLSVYTMDSKNSVYIQIGDSHTCSFRGTFLHISTFGILDNMRKVKSLSCTCDKGTLNILTKDDFLESGNDWSCAYVLLYFYLNNGSATITIS